MRFAPARPRPLLALPLVIVVFTVMCCLGKWAGQLAFAILGNAEQDFQWEMEKRIADGELSARFLDNLALQPLSATPSALLPPDRVVEHVLKSLALLQIEEATQQAFLFTWLDQSGESRPERRQNWNRVAEFLEKRAFSQVLYEEYAFLLDRPFHSPRFVLVPQWSDDDRHVSFFIALDENWKPGVRHVGPVLVMSLQKPAQGSHRDCWLVDRVSLLPLL